MATNAIPTIKETPKQLGTFRNEAFLNFSDSAVKTSVHEALDPVGHELGREYPLVIGGERVKAAGKIVSTNPARPAQTIGTHPESEVSHIEQAVEAAATAFESWSRVPVATRVQLLLDVADLIRIRKLEFCAWL